AKCLPSKFSKKNNTFTRVKETGTLSYIVGRSGVP
ncbi:MAG: hypothetical protein ACI9XB_004391, partial [Gammaproteobacteria bacterium]